MNPAALNNNTTMDPLELSYQDNSSEEVSASKTSRKISTHRWPSSKRREKSDDRQSSRKSRESRSSRRDKKDSRRSSRKSRRGLQESSREIDVELASIPEQVDSASLTVSSLMSAVGLGPEAQCSDDTAQEGFDDEIELSDTPSQADYLVAAALKKSYKVNSMLVPDVEMPTPCDPPHILLQKFHRDNQPWYKKTRYQVALIAVLLVVVGVMLGVVLSGGGSEGSVAAVAAPESEHHDAQLYSSSAMIIPGQH